MRERECAFCWRKEHEVIILLEGPLLVCICDECTERAKELVDDMSHADE